MVEKRIVAVFDFDGTLTNKDTFIDFVKFCFGYKKCYWGFGVHSPLLLLMKLHLYPNWKCKEKVFSWFFKGLSYEAFSHFGEKYAEKSDALLRESVVSEMKKLQNQGARIYVISASMQEWVRPVCLRLGIEYVVGTIAEVDNNGFITGRFASKNCYGQEKVSRLLEIEPDRYDYCLIAFGDSRGDKEMLKFADRSYRL